MIILSYTCHILASAWLYIGLNKLAHNEGWITRLDRLSPIDKDYSTLYIASLYFILTSLSTVGYGDIAGTTDEEYLF
jgi:hypothetical protein